MSESESLDPKIILTRQPYVFQAETSVTINPSSLKLYRRKAEFPPRCPFYNPDCSSSGGYYL